MTAIASTFPAYERSASDDPSLSTQHHQSRTAHTNSTASPLRQHLDDADLLTMRRQYANIGLRDNTMSNSADDLSQLVDPIPYRSESSAQDYNDLDDDELHFDNGNNFDYEVAIQERLKRANEEFEHDQTPAELKHRQRVSFDSVVKAVDIVQEPDDDPNKVAVAKQPILPVVEEPSASVGSPQHENSPHEYTVPLNDTQPKEGPTLLQKVKAMQFHGGPPVGGQRPPTSTNATNGSSTQQDHSPSSKPTSNNHNDSQKPPGQASKSSPISPKTSLVSINGKFELQNEDDYTAKHSREEPQISSDDDDEKKSSRKNSKVTYTPAATTKTKDQNTHKPESSRSPHPVMARPKSSDGGKRSDNHSNNKTSKSFSFNNDRSTGNSPRRAKSARVSKSIESFIIRPSKVDFDELNRKAAEKKRADAQKERRMKEEAEEKQKAEEVKAKESFKKWVQDKDAERKRLNEEKRMEKEEEEARQTQCEKELGELREEKYKAWIGRKDREVMMANEFRKLQADDEEMTSGGSLSSIQNSNRPGDHRAFQRWLRQKYEQSREEKRRLRMETRRLHRQQRRSIKRYQLQQDLLLAKSFGYT